VDITEKSNYLLALLQGIEKTHSKNFGEIKAFATKLKVWQKQLRQNVFDHLSYLLSALGDGKSENGDNYADEIVKLQHEFDRFPITYIFSFSMLLAFQKSFLHR